MEIMFEVIKSLVLAGVEFTLALTREEKPRAVLLTPSSTIPGVEIVTLGKPLDAAQAEAFRVAANQVVPADVEDLQDVIDMSDISISPAGELAKRINPKTVAEGLKHLRDIRAL